MRAEVYVSSACFGGPERPKIEQYGAEVRKAGTTRSRESAGREAAESSGRTFCPRLKHSPNHRGTGTICVALLRRPPNGSTPSSCRLGRWTHRRIGAYSQWISPAPNSSAAARSLRCCCNHKAGKIVDVARLHALDSPAAASNLAP